MSNYPPGMSKRDFVRAGIDQPHDHQHEWRPSGERRPAMEDGAAIFHEVCQYAEGEYQQGWECEETRTYRFEYDTLEMVEGEEIELHPIESWYQNDEGVRATIEAIEEALHDPEEDTKMFLEAHEDHGHVTIRYEGCELTYRP